MRLGLSLGLAAGRGRPTLALLLGSAAPGAIAARWGALSSWNDASTWSDFV